MGLSADKSAKGKESVVPTLSGTKSQGTLRSDSAKPKQSSVTAISTAGRGKRPVRGTIASKLPFDIFELLFAESSVLDTTDLLSCLLVNKHWCAQLSRILLSHPGGRTWRSPEALHLFLHFALHGRWLQIVGTTLGTVSVVEKLDIDVAKDKESPQIGRLLLEELRTDLSKVLQSQVLRALGHLGLDLSLYPTSVDKLLGQFRELHSLRLIGPFGRNWRDLNLLPEGLVSLELDSLNSDDTNFDGPVFWDGLTSLMGHHLTALRRLKIANDRFFSVTHVNTIMEARSQNTVSGLELISITGCPHVDHRSVGPILEHAKTRQSLKVLELQVCGTAPTSSLASAVEESNICVKELKLVSCNDVNTMCRFLRACCGVEKLSLKECTITLADPSPPLFERLVAPLSSIPDTVRHLNLESLVSTTYHVDNEPNPQQCGVSLPGLLSQLNKLEILTLKKVPFAQLHPNFVYHLGQNAPTIDLPTFPTLRELDISHHAIKTRFGGASGESALQLFRASLNPLNHLHGVQLREAHLLYLCRVAPSLRSLSLRMIYPDAATDAVVFAISRRLTQLDNLHLERCFVTDRTLTHLAYGLVQPRHLNLAENVFTDVGLKQFINLRGSRLLSLSLAACTGITDASLSTLKKGCPRLLTLYLDGAHRLTDSKIVDYVKGSESSVRVHVGDSRDTTAWIDRDPALWFRLVR